MAGAGEEGEIHQNTAGDTLQRSQTGLHAKSCVTGCAHKLLGICFPFMNLSFLGWNSVEKITQCFCYIHTANTPVVFISCFYYFSGLISKPGCCYLLPQKVIGKVENAQIPLYSD